MRVNVDSSALTDPRIRRLGLRLGIPWRQAFGHLISVWMLCYDRRSNTISCEDADISAELEGFANAMVAADLAIPRGDKIKVRGVDERIDFLNRQKERAVKGGRPRNPRVLQNKPNGLPDENPTVVENKPNSLALAPDLSPALAPDQDHAPALENSDAPSAPRTPRKRQPSGEVQEAIAAFESRFVAAYGNKPTWKGKSAALVAALVKAHGGAEVCRRIDALFDRPPSWLRPPYDVGTLSQHFDKLVGGGEVSVAHAELARLTREARARGEVVDDCDLFGGAS